MTATGNVKANILAGNGATGNALIGMAGNDTYEVSNGSETIIEVASSGTDTVISTVTFTLAANVENLTLLGAGDIDAAGNPEANTLTGNGGDNILNGGTGADVMAGLDGDDTYVVDNAGDAVADTAGTDTVQSSINYTLGGAIENLTLTGPSAINGTGNAGANTLTGNAANNTLVGGGGDDTFIGGVGKDTLTGGAGIDTFVYGATSESTVTDFDTITNFKSAGADKVDVGAIFRGLPPAAILKAAFTATSAAQMNYIADKVSFDIDGDGDADFSIAVTGTPTLALEDFIF